MRGWCTFVRERVLRIGALEYAKDLGLELLCHRTWHETLGQTRLSTNHSRPRALQATPIPTHWLYNCQPSAHQPAQDKKSETTVPGESRKATIGSWCGFTKGRRNQSQKCAAGAVGMGAPAGCCCEAMRSKSQDDRSELCLANDFT